MNLDTLTQDLTILKRMGSVQQEISGVNFDSRLIQPENLFVAIKGTQVDGHKFIEKAVQKGAIAIILEEFPAPLEEHVCYLQVENSAEALGRIASTYYGYPSQQLQLIGVTGTNGKTTTVNLLHDLFSALGFKSGLLSTIENKIGQQQIPATHTTPDALAINSLLADMVEAGCDYAFMEVSSHAIVQRRIAGLQFRGGIFTNLSHDHLDFHKTFPAYIAAKKLFFDDLPKEAFALVNIDDKRGVVMVQNTKAKVFHYAVRKMAAFKARIIENSLIGLHLMINDQEIYARLIGEFNAYNLLSAYATAILLEQEKEEVLLVLSQLKAAEGRFDYLVAKETGIIGIVDYSHTPDALEKVLQTINRLRQHNGQIITVVGCGGDRDRDKRPKMASIACNYSDRIILTSDNPRTEDPYTILKDMEQGIPPYAFQKVITIVDRREAIQSACDWANKEDIILVAGKGHEKYQEIDGVRHPFDDKEILREFLT